MKLLAVAESAAYLAYVSISDTRQMPKEPLYVDFISKKARPLYRVASLMFIHREYSLESHVGL